MDSITRAPIKAFILSAFLLSVGLATFVSFTFDHRGHYTGDSISNDNLWIASKNFATNGFLKLRFVPIHEEIVLRPELPLPATLSFYTHYPPGGDWIHGLLYKLGMHSRTAHQVFSLSLMYVGALLALRVLLRLFQPWPAVLAWSVCILTPSFIFFADSFHAYTWLFLFDWYFLHLILDLKRDFDTVKTVNLYRRAINFFLLGFIGSWFSIDAVIPLLSVGLSIFFVIPEGIRFKYGLILAAAAPLGEFIGFGLNILKNAAVLGGVGEALSDMSSAFLARTGQTNPYILTRHLGKLIIGFPWFFTVPVIILAICGWYRKLTKARESLWVGLFCATLIGALCWQVVMKQHAMIHDFTLRHAELFIVLGFGLFCQIAASFKSRVLVGGVLAFLVTHSLLGVLQIEGTSLKRPLIDWLIRGEARAGWACRQSVTLQADDLQDLHGAQSIVRQLLPGECNGRPDVTGIKGRFGEAVLYWR